MYCLLQNLFGAHLNSLGHKNKTLIDGENGIQEVRHAFNRQIATFRIPAVSLLIDVEEFLGYCKEKMLTVLKKKFEQCGALKVSLELFGQYIQPVKETEATKSFNTKTIPITRFEELDELLARLEDVIKNKASEFEHNDSGMYTCSSILVILQTHLLFDVIL